jgi:hypothetical protein
VPENPREARKRALWNHLYYFLDTGEMDQDPQRVKAIQALHGMVNDERRDIGEMLEVLAWGDIWKERAEWESLDDQARWMQDWCAALEQRLKYWEQTVSRMELDRRQKLLKEKQKRTQQEWLTYLGWLADQQQQENLRLARDVQILEDEWRARQATE